MSKVRSDKYVEFHDVKTENYGNAEHYIYKDKNDIEWLKLVTEMAGESKDAKMVNLIPLANIHKFYIAVDYVESKPVTD